MHILGYSILLDENVNIPSYEWNFPVVSRNWFVWAEMENGLIRNKAEILAQYDYFFVMEDGRNLENQLKMFTKLVYANGNIKLFKKK